MNFELNNSNLKVNKKNDTIITIFLKTKKNELSNDSFKSRYST